MIVAKGRFQNAGRDVATSRGRGQNELGSVYGIDRTIVGDFGLASEHSGHGAVRGMVQSRNRPDGSRTECGMCAFECDVWVRVRNPWFALFKLTNYNTNSSITFHILVL